MTMKFLEKELERPILTNKLEREIVTNKIVNFCLQHEMLDKDIDTSIARSKIKQELKNASFVENLIHTLTIKARMFNDVEVIDELIEILMELEKIRLDLEYKSPIKNKQA